MRPAAIAILISVAAVSSAAAQLKATAVKPPAWQKSVSPGRALAVEDARARGRAAYLAGKSPDELVAEIRAAHPKGGDEIVATALKEARALGKVEVASLKGFDADQPGDEAVLAGVGSTQLGAAEQQRLQTAMDRLSKYEQALSNILRKMSETQGIAGNLK